MPKMPAFHLKARTQVINETLPPASGKNRNRTIFSIIAFAVVLLMILSSLSLAFSNTSSHLSVQSSAAVQTNASSFTNATVNQVPTLMPVPAVPNSVSSNTGQYYNGNIAVLVTFKLSHTSELQALLSNLSNPESPQYHKFLTKSQFTADFAPSRNVYQGTMNYFTSFSGVKAVTYSDNM